MLPEKRKAIEQKMQQANNFNHGFIQNSPTLRFQHFMYFLLKQRSSFKDFESKFCSFDIDEINGYLRDKQLWKDRSAQHSQEYQFIVENIQALKNKLKKENLQKIQRPKHEVKWDVLRRERMEECLSQKAILLEMEKQYIRIINNFEHFLCFFFKRAYYGSNISDKMGENYKKFMERLSNLKGNIAFLNDFVRRKIVKCRKKAPDQKLIVRKRKRTKKTRSKNSKREKDLKKKKSKKKKKGTKKKKKRKKK